MIVALLLNAVLRLGIPRNASLLWQLETADTLKDFAETQGRVWAARVDLIRRAGNFLEEFVALAPRVVLRGSEATLELRYNETGLQIELSWQGEPLHLAGSVNTDDDDGTLQVALMRHWADEISFSSDRGRQTLKVYVDER